MIDVGLFKGHGILLDTDDFNPEVSIGGITNYAVRDNVTVEQEVVGGDIFPEISTITGHDEIYELTTVNLRQVYNSIGAVGACLKSTNARQGARLYLNRNDECSPGLSTTANNVELKTSANAGTVQNYGLIYPGTTQIPHQGNATTSFNIKPKSPGGNAAAIVINENVALPAIPDTKNRFGMGPVSIGGVAITQKQNVEINHGVQILIESADGGRWPEWVAIDRVVAIITIRGIDPTWGIASRIPRGGKQFAHADTDIFIRKQDTNQVSGYVANNVAEHIQVTANGKAFVTELASGNPNQATQSAIVMYVEKDGANAPLIVNTDQAIV